jgi:hypothetical protein
MRFVVCILCGAFVVAITVGCFKVQQKSTSSDKVDVVPSKPEKSISAVTAGEADKMLVEAGRQQLKDKYSPMPVYSRKGALGIIRLMGGCWQARGRHCHFPRHRPYRQLFEIGQGLRFLQRGQDWTCESWRF